MLTSTSGMSIVELMTVVVIIGFLATIAWNVYKPAVARARQAEAKLNLKAIADLEELWRMEKDKYFDLDPIGGAGVSGACADARKKNELGFRPKGSIYACGKLQKTYDAKYGIKFY